MLELIKEPITKFIRVSYIDRPFPLEYVFRSGEWDFKYISYHKSAKCTVIERYRHNDYVVMDYLTAFKSIPINKASDLPRALRKFKCQMVTDEIKRNLKKEYFNF